jgi:putative membrane protein (TIGR04086 family)
MKSGLLQWGKILAIMVAVTSILLLILAFIFYKMNITDNVIMIGIILIYAISNLCGGFIMGKLKGKNKYKWGMLVGLMYFFALTLVSIAMTGQLYSSGIMVLLAFVSSVGGGMLGGMMA